MDDDEFYGLYLFVVGCVWWYMLVVVGLVVDDVWFVIWVYG